MSKLTRVEPHLSVAEIQERIKQTVGCVRVQKWLVIYNAAVDPRPASQIARHTGLALQTVHNLISSYNRQGPSALEGPGKGGRRRAYMTQEEEAQFLWTFTERAKTGEVATATRIQRALEKKLGRSVDKSMVSKMLKRHGWRKVVPRPAHEESDPQEQAAFKKTSRKRSRKRSPPVSGMTPDRS
jgi:transposase